MAGAALRRTGRTPWGTGRRAGWERGESHGPRQETGRGARGERESRPHRADAGRKGSSWVPQRATPAPARPHRPGPARASAAAIPTSYHAAGGRARPSPVGRGGVGSGPARCPAGGAGTGAGSRRPQEPMATPGPARPSLRACARHRAHRPLPAREGEQGDVTASLLKGQRRRGGLRGVFPQHRRDALPGTGHAGGPAIQQLFLHGRPAKGSTGLRKSLPQADFHPI